MTQGLAFWSWCFRCCQFSRRLQRLALYKKKHTIGNFGIRNVGATVLYFSQGAYQSSGVGAIETEDSNGSLDVGAGSGSKSPGRDSGEGTLRSSGSEGAEDLSRQHGDWMGVEGGERPAFVEIGFRWFEVLAGRQFWKLMPCRMGEAPKF